MWRWLDQKCAEHTLPVVPEVDLRTVTFRACWEQSGTLKQYELMPVSEDDFDDPRFFAALREGLWRLCAPFQVVHRLECQWNGGPNGKRNKQFYTPSGGTLARRFYRHREDEADQPRSYQALGLWNWQIRRYADWLWTLCDGADGGLLSAVYAGKERFECDFYQYLTLFCYKGFPFPTDSLAAVEAGVAGHTPALTLFVQAPLLRLYCTIDPDQVDLAWVERELRAAFEAEGVRFWAK